LQHTLTTTYNKTGTTYSNIYHLNKAEGGNLFKLCL